MFGMVPGGWWWHPNNTPDDGAFALANVAGFEAAMGRGVQIVNQSLQNQTGAPAWPGPGADPRTTAQKVSAAWDNYANQSINSVINHPGAVIGLPPRRVALRFQLGVTEQSAAANFAQIISGALDAMFTRIFQAMKDRGFFKPFLGDGQEGNGTWWQNTCSNGNEVAFKAAFRRVAGLAKAVMPDCVVCYDVSNTRPIAGAAYPGDDVVDAIILDYYDRGADVGDSNGIAEVLSLGKPFLVCEWATQDSQRGAAFVDWFWQQTTGSPLFLGQCYWNSTDAYDGSFANNPQSAAEYKAKFGGQNPPIYSPPPIPTGSSNVHFYGWPAGGNPTPSFELFVNGTSYGQKTIPGDNSRGDADWTVPIVLGPGSHLAMKMTAGNWYTVDTVTCSPGGARALVAQLGPGASASWTL